MKIARQAASNRPCDAAMIAKNPREQPAGGEQVRQQVDAARTRARACDRRFVRIVHVASLPALAPPPQRCCNQDAPSAGAVLMTRPLSCSLLALLSGHGDLATRGPDRLPMERRQRRHPLFRFAAAEGWHASRGTYFRRHARDAPPKVAASSKDEKPRSRLPRPRLPTPRRSSPTPRNATMRSATWRPCRAMPPSAWTPTRTATPTPRSAPTIAPSTSDSRAKRSRPTAPAAADDAGRAWQRGAAQVGAGWLVLALAVVAAARVVEHARYAGTGPRKAATCRTRHRRTRRGRTARALSLARRARRTAAHRRTTARAASTNASTRTRHPRPKCVVIAK